MKSTLTQDLDGKTGMMQESMLKMLADDRWQQNYTSRVWDIIDKTRIGMLTTRFSVSLRARPMEARVDRDGCGFRIRQAAIRNAILRFVHVWSLAAGWR